MFDQAPCSTVRRLERPQVDLTALEALTNLLAIVVSGEGGNPSLPSTASERRADLRSDDRDQGADHAPIPPKFVQLDLFGPREGSQPLDTPPWKSLPQSTRRQATILMAQLFLEHHRTEADADPDSESDDV